MKTLNVYLDGIYHADVIAWALAANKTKDEAKKHFESTYGNMHEVTFKVEKKKNR